MLAIASESSRATAPVERILGARSAATRDRRMHRTSAQNVSISAVEPAQIGT
jgi:hypothetical protein